MWKELSISQSKERTRTFSQSEMLQALISRTNPVTSISDGKKRQSRWDTEPGADGVAVDGGDVATKKGKPIWASDNTQ